MFLKPIQTKDKKPNEAPIEIWDHFVQTHRFFKWLSAACVVLAGVGLAGGAYGMLVALHDPLVFAVDAKGQAFSMGRREDVRGSTEAEIRYVAKRFLQKTLAFRSDTIEADLADAMNLMTEALRAKTDREFRDYKMQNGDAFVTWVKKQRIDTRLSVDEMTSEIHPDSDRIAVHATGRVATFSADRPRSESETTARRVEARLTLVRVPRTESTPHGLLVSQSATRFHDALPPEPSLKRKAKAPTNPGRKR